MFWQILLITNKQVLSQQQVLSLVIILWSLSSLVWHVRVRNGQYNMWYALKLNMQLIIKISMYM